jgi:hypothetical protein
MTGFFCAELRSPTNPERRSHSRDVRFFLFGVALLVTIRISLRTGRFAAIMTDDDKITRIFQSGEKFDCAGIRRRAPPKNQAAAR